MKEVDTDLQYFIWLGKAFKELALIFGSASSAGIFDAVNKLVLFIVIKKSGIKNNMVIQHLDDVCAAGKPDHEDIFKFDRTFSEIAKTLGIKLAPRDNKDKSFAPSTSGTILGIHYDTIKWCWSVPEERLTRLLHNISDIINSNEVKQEAIWSVTGKILNIKPLIPGGDGFIHHIIRANNYSKDGCTSVPVEWDLRCQLEFWLKILPICSGNLPIPDVHSHLPPWCIEVYTDSAGGSFNSKYWHGAGVVTVNFWAFVPWTFKINSGGMASDGKAFSRKMSMLELVGPLLTMVTGYQWCRGNPVRIWVDNMGSVCIFKKGYTSSCRYATTLVLAIKTVAAALQCNVQLEKITRCSNHMAELADALSKGRFDRFRQIAKLNYLAMPLDMPKVPRTLLRWLKNPVPDDNLGHKLLEEMKHYTSLLSYNC